MLYAPGITKEQALAHVQRVARTVAYDHGPAMTYTQVAQRCDARWPARLVAEGCELAGFPVWSSAPDEAMQPY